MDRTALRAGPLAHGQRQGAVAIPAPVAILRRVGRGDLLVVEATYAVAARVDPVSRRLSVADDPTAPGVVDDVVDELIEAVLRYRGRVAIVDEGALAPEVGRVGLVTRGPV